MSVCVGRAGWRRRFVMPSVYLCCTGRGGGVDGVGGYEGGVWDWLCPGGLRRGRGEGVEDVGGASNR